VFQTASPFDTPRLMDELIDWTNAALRDKSQHPLLVIAVFTVTFLEIHPFQDGNGRLSRVLTTLLLLKSGYSYVPYSSLESVIEANKRIMRIRGHYVRRETVGASCNRLKPGRRRQIEAGPLPGSESRKATPRQRLRSAAAWRDSPIVSECRTTVKAPGRTPTTLTNSSRADPTFSWLMATPMQTEVSVR
jgi:hypothetical protein